MTGIERLRGVAGFWSENNLDDIVEQIEREHVSRMRVLSVVTEMERHCLGHDGMEDSPVYRWARELREALGGDGRAPTEYVSVSAYDLPPQEDREAIAWVREHGGLDHVRSQWGYLKGRANHADHVDRQLEKRQRQIDECHDALRRRNEDREQYVKANERLLERGAELHRQLLKAQGDALEKDCNLAETKNDIREVCLAHGIDVPSGGDALDAIDMRLHDMQKALDKRPMPEGMEWLVEAWPRFEDGEPVRIGDEVETANGQAQKVRCMKLMGSTFCLCDMFGVSFYQSCYRNSVKRPTPNVLDADGAEIRVGDRVWSTQLDEPHEWIVIDPHGDRDDSQTVLVSIGDRTGRARPENLTHRTPVIAADGRPLRVGDTVFSTENYPHKSSLLKGEEVTVTQAGPTYVHVKNYKGVIYYLEGKNLTHERPVADTWERLEEDAMLTVDKYRERHRLEKRDGITWPKLVKADLVRRAKALAERDA